MKKVLKIICFIIACLAFGGGIYLLADNFTLFPNDPSQDESFVEPEAAGNIHVYATYFKGSSTSSCYALGGGQVRASSDADGGGNVWGSTYSKYWVADPYIWGKPNTGYHVYAIKERTSGGALEDGKSYSHTVSSWVNKTIIADSGFVRTSEGTNKTIFQTTYWVVIFQPNSYSLVFNGNGNTSGSMSRQTCWYDTSSTINYNAFSKTGYTFAGWNTKSDGTGTNYSNGQSITNLTSTNGGTINLYAKWTANTYSISFNGNGNTGGSTSSQTNLKYGTTYTLNANGFTRTGHSFKGWSTSSNPAINATISYSNRASVSNLTSTNNRTVNLYAVWTRNPYTITYSNGLSGSLASTTTHIHLQCQQVM